MNQEQRDAQFTETMASVNYLRDNKLITEDEYKAFKETFVDNYQPSKKTEVLACI